MNSQLSRSPPTSSPYHFVPIPFQGEEDAEEENVLTTFSTTSRQQQQVIISPSSIVATTLLHVHDLYPSSSSSYMTPKKTNGFSSDHACSGLDAAAAAAITPPPPPPPALHQREEGATTSTAAAATTVSYESVQKILFPTLGDDDGSRKKRRWCGVKRHSGSIINNDDLDLPSFKLLPRRSQIENLNMHQNHKKQRKQLQQGGDKVDDVSFSLSLPLF